MPLFFDDQKVIKEAFSRINLGDFFDGVSTDAITVEEDASVNDALAVCKKNFQQKYKLKIMKVIQFSILFYINYNKKHT